MNIWYRLQRLLETLYTTPHLLHGQGQQHERSFEYLLVRYGILPVSFSSSLRTPTIGYERHPYGAQRWPDFHIQDQRILLPVELKTSSRPLFHIGQTWIQSDALYIASYYPNKHRHSNHSNQRNYTYRQTQTRNTKPSVFISWGKDMKTEEEDRRFREFQYDVKHLRGQKIFSSPVEWYPTVQVTYRLEEERRRDCFERVREDLARWARR